MCSALLLRFPISCIGSDGLTPGSCRKGVLNPDPPAGGPTAHPWAPGDTLRGCSSSSQGFELGTLAGPAFARLRRSLGLAEEDYQAALGPGRPYLQFLSTSKSKASFFLS